MACSPDVVPPVPSSTEVVRCLCQLAGVAQRCRVCGNY